MIQRKGGKYICRLSVGRNRKWRRQTESKDILKSEMQEEQQTEESKINTRKERDIHS